MQVLAHVRQLRPERDIPELSKPQRLGFRIRLPMERLPQDVMLGGGG
jgi:hypothetical protein